MADYDSVLVVRLSSLGDVLFAVPAVQALVASGKAERVSWLVEDRAAELARSVRGLHEVVVFPRRDKGRWPAHARGLRQRRDDVVLDLQGNLKSRLQLALLRAPVKLGFDAPLAKEGAQKALTERFLPAGDTRHRVAANAAILARLGIHAPLPVARPRIELGADGQQGSPEVAGSPFVVLHPGTSAFGELKRWAPERFAALGDALVRQAGARVEVSGGPGEEGLVDAVLGAMREPSGRLRAGGLPDLARALRAADLVVASDSLPLHLANAFGTPCVGLYGPKDPAVTGPYYDGATVVRSGVACSPCTLRRCGDRICMERLRVQPVLAAALERLEAGRP